MEAFDDYVKNHKEVFDVDTVTSQNVSDEDLLAAAGVPVPIIEDVGHRKSPAVVDLIHDGSGTSTKMIRNCIGPQTIIKEEHKPTRRHIYEWLCREKTHCSASGTSHAKKKWLAMEEAMYVGTNE